MFSGNEKISCRQMYRNYAVCFVSLGALLIPVAMDRGNVVAITIALVFTGLSLAVSSCVPPPESKLVKALCYVHFWVLGTMAARMCGLLIQEFLLTDTGLAWILAWFYLFCYYNLYKGLECRSRVSEILFPLFALLFVLLFLLALGEVEFSRCRELSLSVHRGQLRTGYELFAWLSAVQGLWHLKGQVQKDASYKKAVGAVWLTGALSCVLWGLFTYGIYGNAGHTGLVFPLASAMTLARFPGNVIGRLDALFVFAWVIGLFLLCSTLFSPLRAKEPDGRGKIVLFFLMAASFLCALRAESMDWCRNFLCYVSVPVQILLLLCSFFRRRHGVLLSGVLLAALLLSACGNQELEERGLIMAVGVEEGEEKLYSFTFGFGSSGEEEEGAEPFSVEADSLAEAKGLYYESNQKNMDFNHLKNFYFSEGLLRNQELSGLLKEIQLTGTYSRGISVYASLGNASEGAGKKEQPEGGMPVHRLLNAWYNKEYCEIPAFTAEQTYKGSVSWP